MVSCVSSHSVALPHGAVGWSAVCYCGMSGLYSLAFSWKRTSSIGSKFLKIIQSIGGYDSAVPSIRSRRTTTMFLVIVHILLLV